MLETIIAVLTYIHKKKWISHVFDLFFGVILLLIIGIAFYWLFDGFDFAQNKFKLLSDWVTLIVGVILVVHIFIINFKKTKIKYEYSGVFRGILVLVIPLFAAYALLSVFLSKEELLVGLSIKEALIVSFGLSGILLAVYPTLTAIGLIKYFAQSGWLTRLTSWAKSFNTAFAFVYIFVFVIAVVVDIFSGYSYIDEILLNLLFWFVVGSMLLPTFWSVLRKSEKSFKKLIKSLLVGVIPIFILIQIPIQINNFYERQITKAENILQEVGENQAGFEKVQDLWLLERSFVKRYQKEGRSFTRSDKELFSKIFDDTLDNRLAEVKLEDADDLRSRRTDQTSMLAQNENAAVELKFAQYDTVVYPEIGAMKTTVTYEFQNTKNSNQEVVFTLRLPKAQSVVTDLKLGLNLDKQGVVAPRGAAERVYRESLQRQIDPALIAQIGPNMYRLRVYPVLSKRDKQSQGRQKVQFEYLTPLSAGEKPVLSPAIEVINLRIMDDTQISVRAKQDGGILLYNEAIAQNQREFLASGYVLDQNLSVSSVRACLLVDDLNQFLPVGFVPPALDEDGQPVSAEEYLRQKRGYFAKHLTAQNSNFDEVILFFDVSASAGGYDDAKQIYQQIAQKFKEQNIPVQVQLFNFDIYPATTDLRNIDFWGYTDSSVVIKYLHKNKITSKKIVIVTDGAKYEMVSDEVKGIDYQAIGSNVISVLQIGSGMRVFRDEVTKAVLASGGTVANIASIAQIDKLDNALTKRQVKLPALDGNCTAPNKGLVQRTVLTKLQAGQLSNYLLTKVANKSSWMTIADKSGTLAKIYGVTNLFASYIALETDEQKRDLEKYSDDTDRYDAKYENFQYDSSRATASFTPSPIPRISNNLKSSNWSIPQDTYMPGDSGFSRGGSVGVGLDSMGLPEDSGSSGNGDFVGLILNILTWLVISLVPIFMIIFIAGWIGYKRSLGVVQKNDDVV